MTVRADVRYDDVAPSPAQCQSCGARVLARKASWEQTSVQWDAESAATCLERRASSPREGVHGAVFLGCTALRDSLREAAVRGDLPVIQEEEMPTNPEADQAHQEASSA